MIGHDNVKMRMRKKEEFPSTQFLAQIPSSSICHIHRNNVQMDTAKWENIFSYVDIYLHISGYIGLEDGRNSLEGGLEGR